MRKVVLEITPQDCYRPFKPWGTYSSDPNLLDTKPESIALVVFTGGTDVDPTLYGEKRGKFTGKPDTRRDEYEKAAFERARQHKIPMVGICRGAQFLCVMAGGKLVQDMNGHGGMHTLRTHDRRVIECNSTHHQMQLPPVDAKVLAYADQKLSNGHYLNGDNEYINVQHEVEVAYYPNINALGIQYHPEWLEQTHPCVRYAQQCVREFLFP